MADARALLRQQRAARRIAHPHAAYSDAGKLCTLCHEHVKAESLWEGHVRSGTHQLRLQGSTQSAAKGAATTTTNAAAAQSNKRKHGDTLDGGDDNGDGMTGDHIEDESVRKKRSRPDMTVFPPAAAGTASVTATGGAEKDRDTGRGTPPSLTPPLLRRAASGTPAQGVEMQIPSRPATPSSARDGSISGSSGAATSVASTPRFGTMGKSPLIPQEPPQQQQQQQQPPTAAFATLDSAAPARAASASTPAGSMSAPTARQDVDEDEWAAFEAEMVHGAPGRPSGAQGPAAALFSGNAVIAAPAVSAEEVAARSQEEERARRRALADVELEDEKEEATRALETEFEEMEELEARVRKLKERREALRQQGVVPPTANNGGSGSNGDTIKGVASISAATAGDKENTKDRVGVTGVEGEESEGEDDEDDEDDVDDWAGFRFRS